MIDSPIALRKTLQWYDLMDTLDKIKFLEYLWSTDKHKMEYSAMSEPERRFHDPKAIRPSKGPVEHG